MSFHQGRRELFNELVFGGDAGNGISEDGQSDMSIYETAAGHGRRMGTCTHGHWCESFAALQVVGKVRLSV